MAKALGVIAGLVCFGLSLAQAAEPMVLKRGNEAEPDTLDPLLATTTVENNIVGDMFLGLTTEDVNSDRKSVV